MNNVDRMLDALEAEANGFSAYEQENFTPAQIQRMNKIQRMQGRPAVSSAIAQKAGDVTLNKIQGTPSFKAQFDIKVEAWTGTSTAIGTTNQFVLFGASQLITGYYNEFTTRPTSVAWGGNGSYTNANRVTITHASNLGVVYIYCDTVNYPSFVQSLLVDRIVLNRIRVNISNTTAAGLQSLQQSLFIKDKSLFGKETANPISIASYRIPEQFQTGIVDIPTNIPLGKDTYILGNIVQTAAYDSASALTQTITFSMFVDIYTKN